MSTTIPPRVVILAGPNGAGKSTAAPHLLRGPLDVEEFVNADTIALGLSAFHPQSVAFEAGRVMLKRLHELAEQRKSFALETTLATRSYASWIRELQASGYEFHLVFLWLAVAELAVGRVADRVAAGGHHIPTDVIHRRYAHGLKNLHGLYLPLADTWRVIDNQRSGWLEIVAEGRRGFAPTIHHPSKWEAVCK